MNKSKKIRLEKHGWKVGTADDFLGLSPEEKAYVEMKVSLSQYLQKQRQRSHLTQEELARRLKSSQSRVVKMEKSDPTVSLDLLVKSLLAIGISRRQLAKAIS